MGFRSKHWWCASLLLVAACCIGLLGTTDGVWAQSVEEELLVPLTPADFHKRECERLRRIRDELETRPFLSTQADFDALYYDLTLDIRDFNGRIIYGSALIRVRSLADDLDELVLDLCTTLAVDSVIGNGALSYVQANNLLTVSLDRVYPNGEQVEVTVYYHGQPCQTNLFTTFTYLNRQSGARRYPTIFTLSEPYGARDWWPSKNVPNDKADSVRVAIIVADTLTATSNGLLESVTPVPPSSRKFTWIERYPIATYLVSIAATNYAHYTEWYIALNGDSVPLEHYPYPEKLNSARTSWNALPAMLAFNAQLYGEYPFVNEKYGHTMMSYSSAAMEHQCNTSYDRLLTDGYHTYDFIVQHEAAHQWWGDDVSPESWAEIWLNEGFASYSEALWVEHLNGFTGLRNYMFNSGGLRVTDPSGPVYNPTVMFDGNTVYNKGGWILHMLRGAIRNDSLFFAGLREYRARNSYGSATTEELFEAVADVVGYDVLPFVWTYLYRTNRPVYNVSFGSDWINGRWQTIARIRQTQTNPDTTFFTRLDLRFTDGGDTARYRVDCGDWEERYYFNLPFAPSQLTVDPDDWVLKTVNYEPLPLSILTPDLKNGREGVPYADTLRAIGQGPIPEWEMVAGGIPGVVLNSEGMLSGSPSENGIFEATVRVTDELRGVDEVTFSVEIAPPLQPPQNVTICVCEESRQVRLQWSAVADADSYRVLRGLHADLLNIDRVFVTADTILFDSLHFNLPGDTTNVLRFYEVHSIAAE